jgi:nitroreductase
VTRTARAHGAFHCSASLCFVVETVVGGYTMTNTNMSLFDAIYSQRAIRHFSAQPVSDEAIATILNAAIHAPSGGNRQPWRFVVIRDADIKRRLGQWYLAAWQTAIADMEAITQPYRHGAELAQHMATVPVLILACIDHGTAGIGPGPITRGASIYPAIQNLLLAARALGQIFPPPFSRIHL